MDIALPLSKLIEQLAKLPGVGRKSAQRLAFHLLSLSDEKVKELADAILDAKNKIHSCEVCGNFTDEPRCSVCMSPSRDVSVICVVENSRDVIAFERTKEYNGLYHVLNGLLSPMDGIGPEQLNIRSLLDRIQGCTVTEIIMATNPTIEGETTAIYISNLLRPLGVKVTRLASGIPVGGNLEYADESTLCRALEYRSSI